MSVYDDRENNLAIPIDRLEKDIQDFKSSQRFGGKSLKIYHIQNPGTWDIVGANMITTNPESKWRVTFTPEEVDFYVEFELNWQITQNPTDFDAFYVWDDNTDINALYSKSFIVWSQNDFGADQKVNLKFAFKTKSLGTISWTRLV